MTVSRALWRKCGPYPTHSSFFAVIVAGAAQIFSGSAVVALISEIPT